MDIAQVLNMTIVGNITVGLYLAMLVGAMVGDYLRRTIFTSSKTKERQRVMMQEYSIAKLHHAFQSIRFWFR